MLLALNLFVDLFMQLFDVNLRFTHFAAITKINAFNFWFWNDRASTSGGSCTLFWARLLILTAWWKRKLFEFAFITASKGTERANDLCGDYFGQLRITDEAPVAALFHATVGYIIIFERHLKNRVIYQESEFVYSYFYHVLISIQILKFFLWNYHRLAGCLLEWWISALFFSLGQLLGSLV